MLIVRRAEPFTRSATRRLVQHPKFFFFDGDVRNGLLGNFATSADRIGSLFEHLIFSQLVASAAAPDRDVRLSSYRTEHGGEVDVVVELRGRVWAIELKASRTVGPVDLRGLCSFRNFYGRPHEPRIWYLGDAPRVIDGVTVQPWQEGSREMGL